MRSLPDDLVGTILLRVPAFDLVRCKGVCKVWRSLISSANFIAAHIERSKSDPSSHHLLVRNGRLDLLRRPIAGLFSSLICFSSSDLVIVGSVNGLICISGKGDPPYVTLSPHDIWILNPVTGFSMKLPYTSRVRFGTDQNVKIAFWCDEDGVYRVAKILSNPNGTSLLDLWVSTSPDTWTVISTFEFDFHSHPRRFHACDVLVEGLAAYWILVFSNVQIEMAGLRGDDEIIVVSLDFKSLALNKLTPLSERKLQMQNGSLWKARYGVRDSVLIGGNLNGGFVLVAYNFFAGGEYYDVWTPVMNDTGAAATWIKKFTICLDCFPFHKGFGIVNDKLVLENCRHREVALYDPLTRMLEVVETNSKLEIVDLDSACGFVGSLVSIDGFDFEWNDFLIEYMGITWPYSLYPSTRKEGWRNKWEK